MQIQSCQGPLTAQSGMTAYSEGLTCMFIDSNSPKPNVVDTSNSTFGPQSLINTNSFHHLKNLDPNFDFANHLALDFDMKATGPTM